MSRVIAGELGGRRLTVPPGTGTRPTSDRVREAMFSQLAHEVSLDGARVLDLFAGSGALALEAVSRGATSAVCVEVDRRAAAVIGRNAASLGVADRVQVRTGRCAAVLAAAAVAPFDVVFADPPYELDDEELAAVLALLTEHGWVADGSVVLVERATRTGEPTWPVNLRRFSQRRYGETTVWWTEAVSPAGGELAAGELAADEPPGHGASAAQGSGMELT